jgi:hypothetical protein
MLDALAPTDPPADLVARTWRRIDAAIGIVPQAGERAAGQQADRQQLM